MKTLLLLVALLLACRSGAAQPSRPAARPDSVAMARLAAPAADTVAALHRLFAARRRRQLYMAGATVAIGTATVALIGAAAKPYVHGSSGYGSLSSGPLLDFTGFEQASVGILTALVVGVEALSYAKFTRKAEPQAVIAAQMHKLPPTLKRQLSAKYFH